MGICISAGLIKANLNDVEVLSKRGSLCQSIDLKPSFQLILLLHVFILGILHTIHVHNCSVNRIQCVLLCVQFSSVDV